MPLPIINNSSSMDAFISDKMDRVSEAPKRPQNLYKQKVPSWIRWPVRVLLLPYVWLDTFAQRCSRLIVPPPYKTEGSCRQRGACCHYILIEKSKGLFGRLYLAWFTQFQGFYPLDEPNVTSGKKTFVVMGCRYLKKDGRCKHYLLRPQICRKWPVIEHFGAPELLKGCGYKATLKKKYAQMKKREIALSLRM